MRRVEGDNAAEVDRRIQQLRRETGNHAAHGVRSKPHPMTNAVVRRTAHDRLDGVRHVVGLQPYQAAAVNVGLLYPLKSVRAYANPQQIAGVLHRAAPILALRVAPCVAVQEEDVKVNTEGY
ncbi:hypothetical protein ABL78_1103 [Leptomonas seymouri]|uniref:Uncharacterized protein n=1 Tax=Leptomonas seymouri TaxID=5684 RepID=A0A0N1I113_LEPSE|nr:hypothetical protein ABL78_1103 [Leptomonas seymouri]|eukprot:KPI89723.1 hypothetical protein ABL78_1103 [Leptomonas seymouri]